MPSVFEVVGKAIDMPETARGLEQYLKSGEAFANEMKSGSLGVKMLKDYTHDMEKDTNYWYELDKKLKPNMTPDEHVKSLQNARNFASEVADINHLGTNRNKLSQTLRLAAIEKGPAHANELGDYYSTYLREQSPKQFWTVDPATGKKIQTNWRAAGGIPFASPYKSAEESERELNRKLSYAFLGLVGLKHIPQNLNAGVSLGFRTWGEAWANISRDPIAAEKFAMRTGVLNDEIRREWMNIAAGRDTKWNKMFYMPGFKQVRWKYIVHAAETGRLAGIEAAEEFAATMSRRSELTLGLLQLDPQKILRQGVKLLEEDELRAGAAAADENMFVYGGKTPTSWQKTNWSRRIFLYKSFQFREGKFLYDTIKRALSSSDPATITRTIMGIGLTFTAAGHLIGDMQNIVAGKLPFGLTEKGPESRSDIPRPFGTEEGQYGILNPDERIDDLSHMAAFGIWYSLARAVMRRRTMDYASGPMFALAADLGYIAKDLIERHPAKAVKQILRRTPIAGPAIGSHFEDIEDYLNIPHD